MPLNPWADVPIQVGIITGLEYTEPAWCNHDSFVEEHAGWTFCPYCGIRLQWGLESRGGVA